MDLRSIADIYPLSPLQEYELSRHRQGTLPEARLGQLSCLLTGKLDLARLTAAWQQALNRHSILRTFFVWERLDKPLQLIPKQLTVTVESHDWIGLPSAVQGEHLRDFLERDRKRGFDPSRPPLERLSICRSSADLHQLICTYHPLVLDEQSARAMLGEVFESYEGRDGVDVQQPASYKSYVEWLRGQAASGAGTLWLEAAEGLALPARFLSDRQPELVSPSERDWQRLIIPTETLARLRALAEQHHLGLEEILQAAWAILLGRYSDASEVLFGIQVPGRPALLPGSASMLGAFNHTLPFRARLTPDMTRATLLQQIGERRTQVRKFEDGTAAAGPAVMESSVVSPLFESILRVEENGNGSPIRLKSSELEILETQSLAPAESPLFARAVLINKELVVEIGYDRSAFDSEAVGRMCGHLRALLEGVASEPHRHLSTLSLLTPTEYRELLVDWNDTSTLYPRDKGVHELFEKQATLTPEAIAVVTESERLTYRELNERANQVAHYLRTLGVAPEMLVGICTERSLEMIVGLLGILKAGGAYLPLDPAYPMERLHFMLDDAQVPVLLTQERLLEGLPSHWAQVVCLDADWETIATHDTENPPPYGSAQNLVYVMYTSGSTGTPKGVSVTHQNVVRLVKETNYASFQSDDVFLQLAPFSFDAATFEIWGPLLNGARLVVPSVRTSSLDEIGEAIRRHGVTSVWFTAGLFHLMVNERLQDLSGLRQLLAGGDVLSAPHVERVLRQLKNGSVINGYGPTESTTFACCYAMTSGEQVGTTIPIGRPIANTRVYIVNRQMQPLPVGIPGELLIGGDGLARGYLNHPELTAERFIPDPFSAVGGARLYRTGDLARYLSDGRIEFLGRIDSQVKVRGFRVELGEIEAVLADHVAVRNVVVVAREDGLGDKRIAAYVVACEGAIATASELRAHLKKKLPEYMLPSAIVLLDALPLNPNGKVDRAALPSPDVARAELESSFAPPTTAAERALAGIWEQVLGLDRISIHDNFFDLGGDSIRSIQVRAQALQLGLDLSIQQIFQHQTIYELAGAAETIGPLDIRLEKSAPFSLVAEEDLPLLPNDVEDAYPLSRLQAGMLFHSELDPESAIYHDMFSFHLEVPQELETLREAIRQLIRRHPILRTSFDLTTYSEPLQLVHRDAEPPIEVSDLSHLSRAEQEEALGLRFEAEKKLSFDWKTAPLLRFKVCLRSEEAMQFDISFHHAILDGWSVASMLTELFQMYFALLKGEGDTVLPAPAASYRDFVALERETLKSEESQRFWNELLRDGAATMLPRWAAPAQVNEVRQLPVAIPEEVSEGLKSLAQTTGVPIKSVLLAAHLRVMSLLAGQRDVVTGVVSNGRPEEQDGERVLGLFLNTLPFRFELKGGTWRELVAQTFEAEREMMPFRRYPMVELQSALGGRTLFESCFNFTHFHVYQGVLHLEGISAVSMKHFEESNFPCATDFSLDLNTSRILLRLDYMTGEMNDEQMLALADYYLNTLAAMAREPDASYERCLLLSAAEQRELLTDWNNTARDYPRDTLIHQLFEAQAERTPEAIAVMLRERQLTYYELNARANQLAHYLRALGVGPEIVVGICLERSLEMIVALLAVLKTGAAYVPLDPAYPVDRLGFILDDSQPRVLLSQQHLRGALPQLSIPVICLDADSETIAGYPQTNLSSTVSASGLAYLIYTSGSTGKPKGVMIEHRSLAGYTQTAAEMYGINSSDRVLQFSSISFDGSVEEIYPCLIQGGTLVLRDDEMLSSAGEFLARCGEQGVTLLTLPTAYWHVLTADMSAREWEQATALRLVVIGSESVLAERVRAFVGSKRDNVRMMNTYGPTEATVIATMGEITNGSSIDEVGIGRPIVNTRLYVLDGQKQPVPIGVPGELYIGGDGLARGYLGRPDLTAERFIPDPFSAKPGERLYLTGDRVRYLPNGNIQYLCRVDQQVKIRGFRIELGEIEATLIQHEAVREAVVIAREDVPGETKLVAYVVVEDGANGAAHELRGFLKTRLPEYMLPTAFVSMAALPLTTNGKVDRRTLPPPEEMDIAGRQTYVGPRTAMEEMLVGLWEEVLGVKQVGVEDNFFELGGHSLLATQVMSRVRAAFGVELPLRVLFEEPTVAGLGAELRTRLSGTEARQRPALGRSESAGARRRLSFAQQRLWFLDQLAPGGSAYNIPAALRMRGALEVRALERSLEEIVRRHEALRTSFAVNAEQQPEQVVAGEWRVRLAIEELSGLAESEREREAAELAAEEAQRPFDLGRGPLWRARLLRLGPEEHVLLFTMHHIVSDGWSMGVLVGELSTLYRAYLAGEESPLPELEVQYGDYAEWQREWLTGAALEEQLSYWRGQLGDGGEVLELPADRVRPAVQSYRGARHQFRIGEEVSGRLRELSRREGATLFMTLLAGWQALLLRYSGQEQISVGTPIAGRAELATEALIGFFVNTLVLRTDLSGEPSFREALKRVREVCLGAYNHQDVPFEKLVEELQPERSLSHTPLFQVMFVLQNAPMGTLDLPGLALSELSPEDEGLTEKFDLVLTIQEAGGPIGATIAYSTDLFDQGTIERMAVNFTQLLASIVARPEQSLTELELVPDAERRQLLVEWNDTTTGYPRERGVHELFETQAAQTPEAVAVEFEDQQLSYAELNRRANQLAHHLRGLGVGPEMLVGICVERSLEMVIGLLAILKAGAAYLPLDPSYPLERLSFMLADAQVPVLLTQQHLLEQLPSHWAHVVCLDTDWEEVAEHDTQNPDGGAVPDNLIYVMYTSGSTGRPKGVSVTHRGVVRLVKETNYAHFEGVDVILQLAPFSFDAATFEIWGALLNGARLVVMPARPPSLEEIGEAIQRNGVTTLWLTAGLFHLMVDEQLDALKPVRQLLAGGDVLAVPQVQHALQRLPATRLINGYGPTENTTFTCCYGMSGILRGDGTVPIGRPVSNTQVYVLDGHKQLVPIGIPGELYIGGDGLARGYLNSPELTAEKFVPHPFEDGARLYRTGDLARYQPDGEIEFLGRLDNQVKIRGFRIELGEIEAVLASHSAVREAVVIARADVPGEKRVVAYVVADLEESQVAGLLRSFLQERLPEYMVPSAFVQLEAMPLNANGKVNRQALPAPEQTQSSFNSAFVGPRTAMEEMLAGLWEEVLGVKQVGVEDNFFELGGHSLLATQVMSRVRAAFGVELPLRVLFEEPTVAGLGAELRTRLSGTEARQRPALGRSESAGARRRLSFAQQRLWFLDQLAPGGSAYNIPAALRMRGALEVRALERSLEEIVRRHEALRTSFAVNAEQQPEQVVAGEWRVRLAIEELSGLAESEREREAAELAAEEAQRPFDLGRGPLWRARLLRLGPEEHVLLFTMHHIVSDGWSMGVLVGELSTLYRAYLAGEESPLPELEVQYGDYAEWQREWLTGAALEEQLSYWRGQLGDGGEVLELPADRVRPAVQSYRGARHQFRIGEEVSGRLRELSRREGATLFMTLLAGWQALLLRYSGQEQISVGTPIAGRAELATEALIGFFVNTLVLRTDLSGEPSFREALKRVREVCLGAYNHQDVPFEKLVEELQPERSLSHTPLFQVMFVLQNAPMGTLDLPGLALSELSPEDEGGTEKFDLELTLQEAGKSISGTLSYSTDLFDRATIERMATHYTQMLESIVARPESRLGELEMLSDAERRRLLEQYNDTEREYPRDATIAGLFERQVDRSPEAIALVFGEERITYAALDRRAEELALRLLGMGVGPETLVGVCVERSTDLVAAVLGVLKAGGAYVPLDPAYPAERVRLMMEDSGAAVLVTERRLAAQLPECSAAVIYLEEVRGGAEERAAGSGRAVETRETGEEHGATLRPGLEAEHLAYVIYTSGSTGRPKGVAISHRSACVLLYWAHEFFSEAELSAVLASTSVCFDLSIFEIFVPLTCGGTVILAADALQLPELRAAQEVTLINTVPSALAELLRLDAIPASVRTINLAGEALRRSLVEDTYQRLPEVRRVLNLYGPTEDTTYSTWREVKRAAQREPEIGRGVANTRLYVLDAALRLLPEGVSGELYIAGEGLARGYLNQPDLTAAKFVPDPYSIQPGARMYRTGDIARHSAGGELEYLGRIDQQVKVRGYRIELGEIEAALTERAEVRDCGVILRETPRGERQLVAFVVPEEPEKLQSSELRAALRERLPEYMVPATIIFMDALPSTPNGKLDRRALVGFKFDDAPREPDYQMAETPIQELLVEIWAEVLEVGRIGINDNFFELGGHSLLATQVMSRVRAAFAVEMPLRVLFDDPTVRGVAAAVTRSLQGGSGADRPELRRREGAGGARRLSFAQQRLWFLEQLTPGGSAYNMAAGLRLKGELQVEALERSLDEVVRRHEALRTSFVVNEEEQPVQVVSEELRLSLEIEDLSWQEEQKRETEAAQLAAQEAQRGFELGQGPLWRARLLRLGVEEHVLLFTMHHIVSDGWSLGVLVREVSTLYRAYAAGATESPLAELEVQYGDYAEWQREWLQGAVLEEQLEYWRKQLGDGGEVLQLPADRVRPAVQSYRGARHEFGISDELSGRLRELSRREGATLFMTLLAGWQALLARYSGQEQISVGTPIAGRAELATEALIGFFVNTLVLRTDLSGEPSFRELLKRVREVCLGAYHHQDVPFEKLVEELQPERSLSHSPLFQVMFVLQNAPMGTLDLPGLALSELSPEDEGGTEKFDLELTLQEAGKSISGTLSYSTDLFDRATIERMATHYTQMLESIVARPESRLGELDILAEAERRQLEEWNETATAYPGQQTMTELFEEQARLNPTAIAIEFGAERLTYGELNQRANQLAHYLSGLGVGPEVLVGICVERSVEMIIGLLGILKAGGAYLPLDPAYPLERLSFMLDDAQTPVLLTQRHLLERLPENVAQVVCLDASVEIIARAATSNPVIGKFHEGLAYVIYTSGSTGRPKGVGVTHRSLVNFLSSMREEPGLSEADVLLAVTSLSFDIAALELYLPLTVGATVVMSKAEEAGDARRLRQMLTATGATAMQGTPATWRLLVNDGWRHDGSLKVLCGGEALPRDLAAELLAGGGSIWNLYGPTETTIWSMVKELSGADELITIGRPIDNTQVYILDKYLRPVPVGVVGELYIAGEGLARGYLKRAELTAEKFVPDPFGGGPGARMYGTGDLARFRRDGEIEYLGRRDQQVKVRGYRIELGEIEFVLGQHPAVQEAVIVARQDANGDKALVAYAVAYEDVELDAVELRSFLRARLPEYMLPSAFVSLVEMPLTANGKVDRRALPAPDVQVMQSDRLYIAPRDYLELQLARVWEEVLGVRRIGVRDSFFDLGGHSLSAVRLMNRISLLAGQEIPLAAIFQRRTIEDLAALLRKECAGPAGSSLVEIQTGGSRQPFFCVHPVGGNVFSYVTLAQLLGNDQPFYGLQSQGLREEEIPLADIEQMAVHYLEELRLVQTSGPYMLGGWSMGGVIAFEMAQRLQRAGEEVALLALFDAPAPSTCSYLSDASEAQCLLSFAQDLGLAVEHLPLDTLKHLTTEEQLGYIAQQAKLAGFVPSESALEQTARLFRVYQANIRALSSYRGYRYQGSITLFLPSESERNGRTEQLREWRALAEGGVELHEVAGTHFTMLREPHVKDLAQLLRFRIEDAQTAGSVLASLAYD